jgi:hypothetical protein
MKDTTFTLFKGVKYDNRHGGPFDRGSADSWYDRPVNPHYYVGGTGTSELVEMMAMSKEETSAYLAGYAYNEEFGGKKSWD